MGNFERMLGSPPHPRRGRRLRGPLERAHGVAREEVRGLAGDRAREKYPGVNPRIISDNGPQFIAKDFKQFIRLCGMTHVRTSPYYPQSNGKLERFHRTIKGDCLRPASPATLEEAQRHVTRYVAHYNTERLHSAIGYVTPEQKLAGMERDIWNDRDAKLVAARQRRAARRQAEKEEVAA